MLMFEFYLNQQFITQFLDYHNTPRLAFCILILDAVTLSCTIQTTGSIPASTAVRFQKLSAKSTHT